MATTALKKAAISLYDLLEPLSEEERLRAINSALLLLGQAPHAEGASGAAQAPVEPESSRPPGEFGPRATRWLTQNGITSEMLEECFHLDADPPEVVADIPGDSGRTRVLNSYLLTGVAYLLKTDEPSFEDSVARDVCEHAGCLDTTNHAKYTKFGNKISGDKKRGWKLLAPGLKEAAQLIKTITSNDKD